MQTQSTVKTTVFTEEARHSVDSFLKSQIFTHSHLDWRNPIDWISQGQTLLLRRGNVIKGLLSLPPEPDSFHWLRIFACSHDLPLKTAWFKLFSSFLSTFNFDEKDILLCLVYQKWMEELLYESNWEMIQKVVLLKWQGFPGKLPQKNKDISIRLMKSDDLQKIVDIDRLCFPSIWMHSQTTLYLAFEQSAYSTVAEYCGDIVGFQISTSDSFRAHLTRLAVTPALQNYGIGSKIVQNMLWHFSTPWIREITVNTQKDNTASLHLYKKNGFKLSGEQYPIMRVYPALLKAEEV